MNLRTILAEEGLTSKRSASMLPADPNALEAMKKLFAKAKVPAKVTSIEETKFDVSIPKGFESMWKDLWVEVKWSRDGLHATVSWAYIHPDGGSNGVYIGIVALDNTTKRWGWRVTATREFGYVGEADAE